MLNSNLNRKERERLYKRKEIIDAASKIFAEKGFSAATLEEIAASAEFGKGTLYNYFSGKEEIYLAIIDEVLDFNLDLIVKVDSESGSLKDFLESYTRRFMNYCLQNKNYFLLFIREIAHLNTDYLIADRSILSEKYDKIQKIFISKIQEGIKSKEIKKMPPEKLSIVYDHFIFSYFHFMISCPKFEISEDDEATFLLSILFEGIINNAKDNL